MTQRSMQPVFDSTWQCAGFALPLNNTLFVTFMMRPLGKFKLKPLRLKLSSMMHGTIVQYMAEKTKLTTATPKDTSWYTERAASRT